MKMQKKKNKLLRLFKYFFKQFTKFKHLKDALDMYKNDIEKNFNIFL